MWDSHRNKFLPLSPTQAEFQEIFAVIRFRKNAKNLNFKFWKGSNHQNELKFSEALGNALMFNWPLYKKSCLLHRKWIKFLSPDFFLAALIMWTFLMVKKLKLEKSHKRAIKAIYLSLIFYVMSFAIGPLVWPPGRRKWRAPLRETAFSLRESTNFYGTQKCGILFRFFFLAKKCLREFIHCEWTLCILYVNNATAALAAMTFIAAMHTSIQKCDRKSCRNYIYSESFFYTQEFSRQAHSSTLPKIFWSL